MKENAGRRKPLINAARPTVYGVLHYKTQSLFFHFNQTDENI